MNEEELNEVLVEFFRRSGDIREAIEKGKLSSDYAQDMIESYIREVRLKIMGLHK